jgi:hypothetical protein
MGIFGRFLEVVVILSLSTLLCGNSKHNDGDGGSDDGDTFPWQLKPLRII